MTGEANYFREFSDNDFMRSLKIISASKNTIASVFFWYLVKKLANGVRKIDLLENNPNKNIYGYYFESRNRNELVGSGAKSYEIH